MWITRLSVKGVLLKDYVVKNKRIESVVTTQSGSTFTFGPGSDENSRAVSMFYGLAASENQKENQLKLF